jgi:uncharacterized protein YdeI (YjbR/CyaY-like superfamily)
MNSETKPVFFAGSAAWRLWLEQHHAERRELLVGFYRKNSGKPSLTWPESVDAALCFGWIDGVRRKIDAESYTIRFTPRRPGSIWSAVNIKRAGELTELRLMHPAGIAAFQARQEKRSRVYSFEQENVAFGTAQNQLFQANPAAWKFFQAQPGSYRRAVTWWVISAKRAETRKRRLAKLIQASEDGLRTL